MLVVEKNEGEEGGADTHDEGRWKMETKRLIVSTNYINLHARERERGRKKEF